MEIHRDFSDLLACLADAKVEFVLVGAYALALHGVPRASRSRTDAPRIPND